MIANEFDKKYPSNKLNLDRASLKEVINHYNELMNWMFTKRMVFIRVEGSIYKCRIDSIIYSPLGVKLNVKRIVFGENYLINLVDYNVSWTDVFSNVRDLQQQSLFDMDMIEVEK